MEINRQGLERLYRLFDVHEIPYVPSEANFVLAKVEKAIEVSQALLDHGVIVRSTASFGMPEWIRVTAGLPEELDEFEAAFESVIRR